MKKVLLILGLIFIFINAAYSKQDTIAVYNLKYNTEFEEKVFENYIKNKSVDILLLSLCVDTVMNERIANEYRHSVSKFVVMLKPEVAKTKSEKSKIQKIFKKAHLRFFQKYDINSYCGKFYSDGIFNCVTGSTFFSLVLDSLGIPFSIKEEPTHTLVLAYPEKFSIPVESTDPSMSILIPDANYKKNYVNYLVENKLVSKTDLQTKGLENIFNEQYYSKTTINPIELIGLLYYNSGTQYLTEENYKKAFQQYEKAYLLYPSDRIKYMLEISLLAFVSDKSQFKIEDLDYLAKLSSYSSNPTYDNFVNEEFNNYTYKYLVNENNEKQYDLIYQTLVKSIKDSTVKSDISTIYFSERGRVCMLKQQINEGWKYISEGYKLNPINVELKSLFQHAFYDYINKNIEDEDFLIKYETALSEFDALNQDTRVLNIGGEYFLDKAYGYYTIENLTKAEKVLIQYESFIKNHPNHKINEQKASWMYANISSAYFRKNNIKMSNSVLARGLKLMPGNPILVRKHKVNVTHEIR